MSVDTLIERLHKVKRTGNGRWMACCPAHNDRNPSLSIRDDDGKVLLHCFAGCAVSDIVAAIGLELSDLFPPDDRQGDFKGQRRPFPASDILLALSSEATIVYLYAKQLTDGTALTKSDLERLLLAANRIEAGINAGGLYAP